MGAAIGKRVAIAVAAALVACAVGGCEQGSRADASQQAAVASNMVERGRYLAAIMDCAGCHNQGSFSPQPEQGLLQGGTVGFEVPQLGVFWPPNLTSHPTAGLGQWSEADIIRAVRTGVRPDGRQLAPAMPYMAYRHLSDEDARALAAYLKSLPPSDRKVPGPAQPQDAPGPYLTVKAP